MLADRELRVRIELHTNLAGRGETGGDLGLFVLRGNDGHYLAAKVFGDKQPDLLANLGGPALLAGSIPRFEYTLFVRCHLVFTFLHKSRLKVRIKASAQNQAARPGIAARRIPRC